MKPGSAVPLTITEYIAAAAPEARAILRKLRAAIRKAAPGATEVISYRMPAFRQGGILVYFAAFRSHIGIFPPVRGDAALVQALAPYAGPKGNLRFPLDQPIPYALVTRIVKLRLQQERAKVASKPAGKRVAKKAAKRS